MEPLHHLDQGSAIVTKDETMIYGGYYKDNLVSFSIIVFRLLWAGRRSDILP